MKESNQIFSRAEVERLYDEFQRLKFPPVDNDPEIESLCDLLELYDDHVSSTVMRVLKEPRPTQGLRNRTRLKENHELEREINRLLSTFPSDHLVAQTAKKYAEYYALMKKLIHAVLAYLNIEQASE